ncbi:sporulation protein YunB [Virgibacillus dakarensis]|nr:sporulation protein YunB [Virgibacillus dakarensis]MTW84703.1 sporulation protein YunB [Virgibacillus dakarensis]
MRRQPFFRKKRTPPPVKNIVVITMILFLLMIWFAIFIVNKGIEPALMDIAKSKSNEFATRGINAAVRFAEGYDFEDVSEFTRNNEGEITSWKINTAAVNEINRYATDRVEEFFQWMNTGEVPEDSSLELEYGNTIEEMRKEDPTLVEIPLGMVTGNTVLANLGPKVPVNMELIGNVKTDVVHKAEAFGINSAMVKVFIHVEAEVRVVIPFSTDVREVSTDVYVDSGVVNLGVPEFYGEGGNNGPSIAVPKDDLNKDLKDNE